jgi:hypothetical protein
MHALTTQITDLQRRLAWRERAVAVCRTLAVAVAAAVVLGWADYVIRFTDRGLRLMLTAALAAMVAWAVYRWWIVPRRHRLVPLTVARRVEAAFPQLCDRLSSAIEFLSQAEDDPTAGSATLRRAVVADAERVVAELPIESIIDRRPLRRAAGWAAAVAALVAVATLIDAAAVRTAAARLVAPLGATEWPRANHLEFRDPPSRLTVGQPFEVELVDRGGPLPDDVRIFYRVERDGRRDIQSEWMTRVGDVMVARRDEVRSAFAFRAEGGDDHTMRWIEVEVAEPPRLDSFTITTHPPAYTGHPAAAAVQQQLLTPALQRSRIIASRVVPDPGRGGGPPGSQGSLAMRPSIEVLAGSGIEVSGTASEALGAARLLIDSRSIAASIVADSAGGDRRAFHIRPGDWIAAESGKYRLELGNLEGVAGIAAEGNVRVEADSPPSVVWLRPSDDLFVLPAATVPIELAVSDNLAVQRVELRYTRSDQSPRAPTTIELYRGPESVAAAVATAELEPGESRTVDATWPLEPLALPVGTQLTLGAVATDYRPGSGETTTPRRVTIITREEFDARVADRLAQLVRRLEESLVLQRTAREGVRRVEIRLRDAGRLTDGDQDALAAAELNQRQVGRGIADPADGVPALADALVAELDANGVEDADTRAQIDELRRSLDQLSAEPLPAAERELTAARKSAQVYVAAGLPTAPRAGSARPTTSDHVRGQETHAPLDRIGSSLVAAGRSQDTIIAELERLVSRLSDSADLGRLVRDLAQLRADQLAHRESTRGDVGLETLPLEWRELSREQRATLSQAAAAEEALSRRYERLERGMETLAEELAAQSSAASLRVADALALARELGIAGQMRQAVRELGENRVGQALAREQLITDALQQVLDTLRDRDAPPADRLAEGLRAAQRDLTALRTELAELREAIAQAAGQAGPAADEQRKQLHQRQQQIRARIERLARQLNRLQAPAAGESAEQAAQRLADRDDQRPNEPRRPADRQQVEQSEQDLAEAARQLAERRREADENLAREFLRRVQAALAAMVADQQNVLRRTVELDAARQSADRLTDGERRTAAALADNERALAEEAHVQSEMIAGLHVFVLALGQAAERLTAAATRLDDGDTGPATQRAEAEALARLEEIVAALAETAAEMEAGDEQPGGGAGAGQQPGGGPSRPPAFDLFEVKLLRSLQAELNRRTKQLHEPASDEVSLSDAQRADRQSRAAELAAEQSRLAELVHELVSRDNRPHSDE